MVAKPLCPLYKNIIKPLDRARYPELRYEFLNFLNYAYFEKSCYLCTRKFVRREAQTDTESMDFIIQYTMPCLHLSH